jgi:hypothetical protein
MNPQQLALQRQTSNKQPSLDPQSSQIFKNVFSSISQGQQNDSNNQGAISQALSTLNPNGKDTPTQVGKAIQTPNYAGYCLQWADDKLGNPNRQPTAIADYKAQVNAGNINTSMDNIPKDAKVYWDADATNGNMGHVGLSNGNSTFTAATDNGIQTFTPEEWSQYSGQKFIGWSPANK